MLQLHQNRPQGREATLHQVTSPSQAACTCRDWSGCGVFDGGMFSPSHIQWVASRYALKLSPTRFPKEGGEGPPVRAADLGSI